MTPPFVRMKQVQLIISDKAISFSCLLIVPPESLTLIIMKTLLTIGKVEKRQLVEKSFYGEVIKRPDQLRVMETRV